MFYIFHLQEGNAMEESREGNAGYIDSWWSHMDRIQNAWSHEEAS